MTVQRYDGWEGRMSGMVEEEREVSNDVEVCR